jgi:hypothetical protein
MEGEFSQAVAIETVYDRSMRSRLERELVRTLENFMRKETGFECRVAVNTPSFPDEIRIAAGTNVTGTNGFVISLEAVVHEHGG